jgi:hypothetical protein
MAPGSTNPTDIGRPANTGTRRERRKKQKMDDATDTRCRSCSKPIRFVPTQTGKQIPLDLESEERRVAVVDGKATVVETWLAHFATCPEANRWRKKKRREETEKDEE